MDKNNNSAAKSEKHHSEEPTEITDRITSIESENEELRKRLELIEQEIGDNTEIEPESQGQLNPNPSSSEKSGGVNLSRRGVLATITGIGLLGSGVVGSSSAATGDNIKLGNTHEISASDDAGLHIINKSSSGQSNGIIGQSNSTSGVAIWGYAAAQTGSTFGLRGEVESDQGVGLYGKTKSDSGTTKGVRGASLSPDGYGVSGENYATSGSAIGVFGKTSSSSGYGLYTPDDARVGGDLKVGGNKEFVQAVDTSAGPKEVHYTAVEAGTPHTEVSDTAEMEDGHALIEPPEHFSMVTSAEEPLTVQVTPHAEERVHPQVVETSTEWISVEDFGDGPQDYRFSYTVKGVREGFEDKTVVQEPESPDTL